MKFLKLFLSIFLVGSAFCVSCNKPQSNTTEIPHEISLSEYVEKYRCPENISLNFQTENVTERPSAYEYTADFFEADMEKIRDAFLHVNEVSLTDSAFGPYMTANNGTEMEYLVIYEDAVKGGFSYSSDSSMMYSKVASLYPGSENSDLDYTQMQDYQINVSLDFMNWSDAATEVQQTFKKVGLPEVEFQKGWALDATTMNEHQKIYLDHFPQEDAPREINTLDEAYLLHFRQVIDDIPLINIQWQNYVRDKDEATEAIVSAIYSKKGICSAEVRHLVGNLQPGEKKELLSAAQALDTLCQIYNSKFYDQVNIDQMELVYISYPNKGSLELIPAWYFHLFIPNNQSNSNPYLDVVLNAQTGQPMQSSK